ncbi:NUDIX domain-containing protein [Patescibacteria group bacterium]
MTINIKPNIHNLTICVNVYIRKDRKYLVIKRSSTRTYLPEFVQPVGGRVELNENPYQAAVREVSEEAGITIKKLKLEAVSLEMHPQNPKITNWLVFHFSANYQSGKIKRTDEGELVMLSPGEFKKEKLFAPTRRLASHIFNPKDGTVFASFDLDNNLEIIKEDIKLCAL